MLTETFKSRGTRDATLIDRHSRITSLCSDIVHHASVCDLVVIEGMVSGAKGGSPTDRSAGWWFIVGALIRREVPVAVVAPTSLKLAITGSGKSDKVQVALALAKLWPNEDLGNNDSADAAGLAHLGAVLLGMPVPTLERHRQVKWTELPHLACDD